MNTKREVTHLLEQRMAELEGPDLVISQIGKLRLREGNVLVTAQES